MKADGIWGNIFRAGRKETLAEILQFVPLFRELTPKELKILELVVHIRTYEAGEPVFLRTRQVVREDAVTLFGFADPEELRLFDLLIAVSGVGPKLALALLSGLKPHALARAIRGESGVPIVMLTAKSDTVDVVLGLESGADDYVVKPFKPKELVARMRARLRRGEDVTPELLTIGPPGNQITIDVPAHTVSRDSAEVKLTPLEFDLLVALARKPRQVFTREVLLEQVWGYRHAADTRLVNVHVQRLRSKVEKDPEHPEVVLTVRGVGYKAGPP